MKPIIYLPRRICQPALDYLGSFVHLRIFAEERPISREEFLREVKGADALLPQLSHRVDGEILDAAGPQLRIVANYAVGFNNIDLRACSAQRIPATNTPGVLTETTADLAFSVLMAVARQIPAADAFSRQGKWSGFSPTLFLGADIFGKTFGIIGMGRIGQAVARRGSGFKMRILYLNRTRLPCQIEQSLNATYTSLDELLRESDFVSLHCPLTPETRGIIGENEMRQMKKTAFLINTARGECVDEKALVQALRDGLLAGAGLDVFEKEPELAPGLIALPNVVITPHIGSATLETRTRMGTMCGENIKAVFEGKRPPNLLNPDIYE
ncbi:MAG: D-glycerate dehydrogenase [Nitrospinae bacterium RIFCSPLOWO2_12_FULL_45_22]|nr:MAG: D-glycerate dehydrogenase [Nitrospinae bacterium RIFCSPLOWO2_12_FULL_45_22]